MVVMASARDLISIFVALETITIPTFVLAGWRKHDAKSNEAAIKYFLIGVLSSAIMLYGMSLVFGEHRLHAAHATSVAPSTARTTPRRCSRSRSSSTLVGFAFKVSAVPFHFWAPDTYEGAPTPVTAFLSVASKAGGFVALLTIIRFGFFPSQDSWQPVLWVLAAASMIFGNLVALRQTNIVRMLAYSSIAQGGFILVPLAVAGDGQRGAVVVRGRGHLPPHLRRDEPRRVRRGDRGRPPHRARPRSPATPGSVRRRPGSRSPMTIFLFSLAGIPPFAGWFAKFVMFRAVLDADTAGGHRPRRDRRGQLGDRVLLLRARSPARCGSTEPDRRHRREPAGARSALTVAIGICTAASSSSSASTRRSSPASASSPSSV